MSGNFTTTAMGSIHQETLRTPLLGLLPQLIYISIDRSDTGLGTAVTDNRLH